MGFFQHKKALVDPKAKIGNDTKIWAFANIQRGAVIGNGCKICDGCFVETGAIIGNHVTIKNGVSVFNGITLEDDVFCGANCAFINDRYPRSHRKDPWVMERTLIKKGVTIGSNATILCGLTIGEYAVIGAGSVVTKNVAPYAIVLGNPALYKGYACRCGRKLNLSLKCTCGLKYALSHQGLRIDE